MKETASTKICSLLHTTLGYLYNMESLPPFLCTLWNWECLRIESFKIFAMNSFSAYTAPFISNLRTLLLFKVKPIRAFENYGFWILTFLWLPKFPTMARFITVVMTATIFQAPLILGKCATCDCKVRVCLGGFAKEGTRIEPKGHLRPDQLKGSGDHTLCPRPLETLS